MSKQRLNDIADDLTPYSNLPGKGKRRLPLVLKRQRRAARAAKRGQDDLTPRGNLPSGYMSGD